MDIVLANSSSDPIYAQVVRQIRAHIVSGRLEPGDPLPSIRALAKDLQISVITTKRAYEELQREGFIDTVGGKGTFVANQSGELLREMRLRIVEEKLTDALQAASDLDLTREQVLEIVHVLLDGGG